MHTSMEFLSQIRSHSNRYSSPCIFCHNGLQCGEKPINSHNIQKNKILNFLSVDNHLYSLSDAKSNNNHFNLSFEKKGIDKVTIFRCLCLKHDTELFRPIELFDYNSKPEQQTLYALKSLLYEYWKLDHAVKHFSIVKSMVTLSTIQKYQNNIALHRNTVNRDYCKDELAILFDMLDKKEYTAIRTYEISLDYPVMFSISQSCCIYTDFSGKPMSNKNNYYPFIHISIFPENNQTRIVFSWLNKDNKYYRNFFLALNKMTQHEMLRKLNLLLPMYCENIVLSPKLFNYWSENERKEFSKVAYINVLPEISTQHGDFCVDNWLGQENYNLFLNLV